MIQLGQVVRDKITSFAGTVTGRVEYITGCTQVLVQPHVKTDGDFVENRWFDEDRCEIVVAAPVQLTITKDGPDSPAPRK